MTSWFLETERLGFRPWTETDLELAWTLWGDPRVTRLIGGPFTRDQVQQRLAREIATEEEWGIQYWPLFRRSDGAHVGCCGLRPYADGVLELGFHVCFDHWGNGYATESARAVIRHAFDALGVGELFAGHHPENADSARLLGKLGFRYTNDELYAPTGLMHPSYRLTRPPVAEEKDT